MFVVSLSVIFLATVRCIGAADPACCSAAWIYKPNLIPPRVGTAECEADRAGLLDWDASPNGEWRIQDGFTVSEAARFLSDFGGPTLYWFYAQTADTSTVPRSNQVLTFFTDITPDIVFPVRDYSGETCSFPCGNCTHALESAARILSDFGVVVIVVDPSVNDDWRAWLRADWDYVLSATGNQAYLAVVPRSNGAYEDDILTGLALFDPTNYGACVPCSVDTTYVGPPTTTTTTTVMTTTTTTTVMTTTTTTTTAATVAIATIATDVATAAAVTGNTSAVSYAVSLMASVAVTFGLQLAFS